MKKNKKKDLNIITLIALFAAIGSVISAFVGVILSDSSIVDFKDSTIIIITSISVLIGVLTATLSLLLKKKQEQERVFIIYSHKDKEKTDEIKSQLIKNGIRAFTDEDILNVGDDINSVIKKYIERSNKVIVILSSNTENSNWINKELGTAISTKKQIYPVKIEDVDLPQSIGNLKYADLREINSDTITPLYKAITN